MKILTRNETRKAFEAYGLDRPEGIGFAFRDRARHTFYGWHTHDYHQLIYAVGGATQFETASGRHLLPTGRAAWIPAATWHRTLVTDADHVSLFFAPDAVADPSRRVRILLASPLMREMILHAARWPRGASATDPLAESFLKTLALLCGEWLESELPLFLPSASHPAIVRAMDYAVADPGNACQSGAVAVAAVSERTFRRLFADETGMSWQAWLTQARMLAAMSRLAEGRRVTDIAADVGYASLSAFAKAFAQLTGESPTVFRARNRR